MPKLKVEFNSHVARLLEELAVQAKRMNPKTFLEMLSYSPIMNDCNPPSDFRSAAYQAYQEWLDGLPKERRARVAWL